MYKQKNERSSSIDAVVYHKFLICKYIVFNDIFYQGEDNVAAV